MPIVTPFPANERYWLFFFPRKKYSLINWKSPLLTLQNTNLTQLFFVFVFFPCGCDGSWNGIVNLAGIWGVYRLITVKFQRMLSVPVEVNHLIDH